MLTDILQVIGLATLSLGTIHESDGVQQHSFWLRNDAAYNVTLMQGYTSCGCTTIDFEKDAVVAPGDSAMVTLRFNPRGKSGDFLETATIAYLPTDSVSILDPSKVKRVQMELEGECVPSDESLMRQFPISINENLSASKARFDVGVMKPGATRTVYVAVLHRNDSNKKETFPVTFSVTDKTPKGVQHVERVIEIEDNGQKVPFTVVIDVLVK